MFVSLRELELRSVPFKLDIPAGKIDFDRKLKQISVLNATGSASLLNQSLAEIRVTGGLRVETETVCDRCLETIHFPVESSFDLVYMPARDVAAGDEDEIDEAGVDVGFYEGDGLELEDVLREVVLLALPMRIVCREACKGICPICGQDRNQRDCNCETKTVDDRWNSLKNLRAEMSREGIRK